MWPERAPSRPFRGQKKSAYIKKLVKLKQLSEDVTVLLKIEKMDSIVEENGNSSNNIDDTAGGGNGSGGGGGGGHNLSSQQPATVQATQMNLSNSNSVQQQQQQQPPPPSQQTPVPVPISVAAAAAAALAAGSVLTTTSNVVQYLPTPHSLPVSVPFFELLRHFNLLIYFYFARFNL